MEQYIVRIIILFNSQMLLGKLLNEIIQYNNFVKPIHILRVSGTFTFQTTFQIKEKCKNYILWFILFAPSCICDIKQTVFVVLGFSTIT